MKSLEQLSKSIQANTHQDLKALFQSGAVLLDVRTSMEFYRTGLKPSLHIPLDQLRFYLAEIRSWNKPVITYSTYGRRSKKAADLLKSGSIKAVDGGAKKELEVLLFGVPVSQL